MEMNFLMSNNIVIETISGINISFEDEDNPVIIKYDLLPTR